MAMRVKSLAAAGFTCAVLGLSACSGAGASGNGGSGSDDGGGGPTLTITSPADGANVPAPVTLKFTSSQDIGPTDSGKDHVHVVIDGKTNDYTVVTATTYQIPNLAPGRHAIGVTLQHADHSSAGASAQVNVNVTGSGGGGNTGGGDTGGDSGDGGGGYGYP